MLVWLSQAVVSWSVFQNYVNSIEEWTSCIRYDFVRYTAYGNAWTDIISTYKNGESCPAFPQGLVLFELQLLKGVFEALLPGTVAVAISWRSWHTALSSCWQSRRKTTSVMPQNAALPHHGPSSGMTQSNFATICFAFSVLHPTISLPPLRWPNTLIRNYLYSTPHILSSPSSFR